MIPRRLYLKGFMCYREETEICFTGPSIWALCGANGAGKSTIFDAMLFALYGEHRMGKQNVEALIHREAESFIVEFDFALGENVYRVKRTFSRKKKGTMLALHLSGPDVPVPGRAGLQPCPGTEAKDGFDTWVLRTVGLNANTFRVAVLLMQGQSDVLLKLGGAEKHDVLTQIIDLSRYETLCKLAGSKQKEQEGLVKSCAVQLNNLEEIDDAHVLDLEDQMSEAGANKEKARQRHLTLTGLKEQAKRWQKLQEDEQQLAGNLAKCTALLDQAAQIEQRATRLDILQKVISPLEQIYSWQGECASLKTRLEQDRKKVQTLGDSLQEQSEKLRVTQRQLTELQETLRVHQEALAQYTTMAQQRRILEQKLDQLSRQEKSQRQIIKKCEKRCDVARGEQGSASAQAVIVLQMLTPDYITLIQGSANAPIDLEVCLQAVYPTSHDLDELVSQLRDKPSLEERLRSVASDVDQRAELVRTRDYVFSEIQPLEQMYPLERVTALLQDQEQSLQRNDGLLDYLGKLDDTIAQQSQQLERLGKEKQQTELEKGQLERAVAIAETKLENAQRSIAEVQETLPAEWQAQIERLSEVLLSSWKQEMKALDGAAGQLRDLRNAQQNYARYQQEQLGLKAEKDLIPEEARQAPAQLEKASEQANLSYQTFAEQERRLSAEIMRLKNIQDRRIELEQQRAGASRLASYYKDLTNLLGRDGLQHYLLQKVEAGIVYHANEILDGISGGTLRLELQSSTDRKAEALDLAAYNMAISASQTQPIRLLSGSQQFRVSVSLALGIGKYAGNENHRLESVIIDEGFGSLDENGRREMIQAIKELGDGGVLKCIIVVSHQREFFDEFPNRYLIELVDGSTQISLA